MFDYGRRSLTDFVKKQGGSLETLGQAPSYTGAPAKRGTPALAPPDYNNQPKPLQHQPQGGVMGGMQPPTPQPLMISQPVEMQPQMPDAPRGFAMPPMTRRQAVQHQQRQAMQQRRARSMQMRQQALQRRQMMIDRIRNQMMGRRFR